MPVCPAAWAMSDSETSSLRSMNPKAVKTRGHTIGSRHLYQRLCWDTGSKFRNLTTPIPLPVRVETATRTDVIRADESSSSSTACGQRTTLKRKTSGVTFLPFSGAFRHLRLIRTLAYLRSVSRQHWNKRAPSGLWHIALCMRCQSINNCMHVDVLNETDNGLSATATNESVSFSANIYAIMFEGHCQYSQHLQQICGIQTVFFSSYKMFSVWLKQ